jgi:HEAT repeat protein
MGPPRTDDAALIAKLLGHTSPEVGYWAATLLGRLEAAGRDSVSDLTLALATSPHKAVRQQSAWALGRMGTAASSALPALEVAAKESDPRLRRLAEAAIKSMQP